MNHVTMIKLTCSKQYGREQYKNLPKVEKQKLVEYRKKIIKWWKKHLIIVIRNYYFRKKILLRKQFWSYKFILKSWFKQKQGWKFIKIWKVYVKMNKQNYKFTSKSWFKQKTFENYKL